MKKVIIYHIDGTILYEVKVPGDTLEDQEVKVTLEKLVKQGKNLIGANLRGTNLVGADLRGADLRGANLLGADLEETNLVGTNLVGADLARTNLLEANLEGSNLVGVNLKRANLYGTNLLGTNLQGASLYGANLKWANLEGAIIKEGISLLKDGYFTVTNIGSEQSTLEIFNTNQGLYFRRDCFLGNEEEFRAAVTEKHGNNKYAKMYLLQIDYAKVRFEI